MCIAAMKTMTAAQKAKNALRGAGIECEIVGLDARLTKNGCAYGIRYPCALGERVMAIFRQRGVAYGEIMGERK